MTITTNVECKSSDNKNLKRIFNILDVPPAERESKVRAGTSDVSSITADADDSTADDSASQS